MITQEPPGLRAVLLLRAGHVPAANSNGGSIMNDKRHDEPRRHQDQPQKTQQPGERSKNPPGQPAQPVHREQPPKQP